MLFEQLSYLIIALIELSFKKIIFLGGEMYLFGIIINSDQKYFQKALRLFLYLEKNEPNQKYRF